MADDRYSWLDEDAAERLLRGEPLDVPDAGAGDGRAAERARRLSAALSCVADPDRLPAGTDPEGAYLGETVVLAAFRETAAGTRGTGPGARGRGLFRTPRTTAGEGRRSALGRPLRAGIAAALAGCALGGVAVAAGAGVLPTPFSHSVEPGPGSSAPGTVSAPPAPGHGAGGTGGESPGDGHGNGKHGEESPDTGGHGGTKGRGGDRDEPAGGRNGTAGAVPVPPGFGDARTRGAAIALCREYTAGTLDGRTRERLEAAVGGPAEVDGYCGRLLHGKDDNDADSSGGGGSGQDTGSGAKPGSGPSGPDTGPAPAPGISADPYLGAGPGGAYSPGVGGGRDGGGGSADGADRPHRTPPDAFRPDSGNRPGRESRREPGTDAGHRDGRANGTANEAANSRANGAGNRRADGAVSGGRADATANRRAGSASSSSRAGERAAVPPTAPRAGTPAAATTEVAPEAG
ncbi:hypothetical protein KBZ10_16720 [Streptomyces sp. F63]|uniref:hypothetical protein n=1 Tax=Streptomyces sp. F63 TaxID=2824887 RepID=UPI001B387382|nr:hypothetical protein [Streptomyces sp. F63]MBQ0986127.1 hypothetical protein [Streptomyces sp. F63]